MKAKERKQWTQIKSESSPTPMQPKAKLGSASGSTPNPVTDAPSAAPFAKEVASPSSAMTAITTPNGLIAAPTTFVPSTTGTSVVPTASSTMVVKYQLGQPLELRAELLPKLDDLCNGWGTTRELAVAKIYNFLTYGRSNWRDRSMDELLTFYFDNFYLS